MGQQQQQYGQPQNRYNNQAQHAYGHQQPPHQGHQTAGPLVQARQDMQQNANMSKLDEMKAAQANMKKRYEDEARKRAEDAAAKRAQAEAEQKQRMDENRAWHAVKSAMREMQTVTEDNLEEATQKLKDALAKEKDVLGQHYEAMEKDSNQAIAAAGQ